MPLNFPRRWGERAALEARESTCVKSKRGAAIFHRDTDTLVAAAANGPPYGFECGGTSQGGVVACREACNRVAVHAEERAIIRACGALGGLEMVHAKIDFRWELQISGEPSCWQCSRMILEAGISHVWLFGKDGWRGWDALAFHAATLKNCELPVFLEPPEEKE